MKGTRLCEQQPLKLFIDTPKGHDENEKKKSISHVVEIFSQANSECVKTDSDFVTFLQENYISGLLDNRMAALSVIKNEIENERFDFDKHYKEYLNPNLNDVVRNAMDDCLSLESIVKRIKRDRLEHRWE